MQPHETEIRETLAAGRQDGENIRALARIAEIHERRLSRLEGPDNGEKCIRSIAIALTSPHYLKVPITAFPPA